MSFLVAAALTLLTVASPATAGDPAPKPKKPSVSLRATPNVGFTPVRIAFVAELRGGSNDYEDFYCATVEWDWGDGTKSEESIDCDPYVAGESEIRRRFSKDHQYQTADEYRVLFRLKKAGKVVGASSTVIRLRPGVRDYGMNEPSR
jgi:hypothetical protein